jgi:2'-5' RNA ligase
LALPLAEHIKERLAYWQEIWACQVSNVKWVEKENLHLTLKFLGEVGVSDLEAVAVTTAKAVAGIPAFSITVCGLGAFPGLWKGRVLWAGVEDEQGRLAALAGRLEECLVSLGFPPEERSFIPHLTLGRVRQPTAVTLPDLGKEVLKVKVEEVVLYQSMLGWRGPVYEVLQRFSLAENG